MGPRSTGSVGPFLLVCAAMFALPLLVGVWAARRAGAATDAGPTAVDRTLVRLDGWRTAARSRGAAGPLAVAAGVALAGVVVLVAVMLPLGRLTGTAFVVRWDRPVYTFFLHHRGSALTHLVGVVTRIGQYPAMAGIALSAAVVVALGLARHRLTLVVLLSAVLVPLFSVAGQLYNWVDVVALAAFGVAALVTRRRPLVAATLLMASMPVEKHVQEWVAAWVDGTVPALSTSLGQAGNFPSGGCTRIVLIAGLVACLLAPGYRSRVARVWLGVMVVALAILEALTRMYLGLHWAVDCVGGWVFGAGLLAVSVAVERLLNGPLPAASQDGPLPARRRAPLSPLG